MQEYKIAYIETTCCHCGKGIEKSIGHYNRAMKLGLKLFCNHACFGLHRRSNKSIEQKKAEKSAYDRHYKTLNVEEKKKKRQQYFKRTYDPVKAALIRKDRMHLHVKYCQSPEYKEWKKKYDQQFRAKKKYGEFYESSIILEELEGLIDRYAASIEQNTYNKSQQRKRQWKNLQRSI